ncbi:MAG: O-antigen ligase family protein [Gammaproteobacteria bacterium]|nr:O-antigen ligase family protein [Gammaproteobacteria bacterium]
MVYNDAQRIMETKIHFFSKYYIRELFVALSLALISQSHLRFQSLPFGVGEILLILMMISTFFVQMTNLIYKKQDKRRLFEKSEGYSRWIKLKNYYITYFPFIFLGLVSISSCVWFSYYSAASFSYMLHNLIAYLFVSFAFLFFLKSGLNLKVTAIYFSVILLLLLCIEFFIVSPNTYFYYSTRLQGLSNNPNQLALYLLVSPVFFVSQLVENYNKIVKVAFFVLFLLTIITAYFIYTSAYFIAYFVSAGTLFLFFFGTNKRFPWCKWLAMSIIALAGLLVIIFLAYSTSLLVKNTSQSTTGNTISCQVSKTFTVVPEPFFMETPAKLNPAKTSHSSPLALLKSKTNQPITSNMSISIATPALGSSTIPMAQRTNVNILRIPFFSFSEEMNVRLCLWTTAFITVAQHPFLGDGAGAMALVIQDNYAHLSEIHNTFLIY